MLRFVLLILTLLCFVPPAHADDITAASRSVVRVVVAAFEGEELVDFSHGSGFAVAPNRIVTNAHVVALAREHPDNYTVGVVPSEGSKSYRARLIAIDPDKDLALLEIVEGSVPPVPLYMGALTDGADVVAIGYPGNVDLATAQSMDDFITPAAPARTEGNYSNERKVGGVFALLHTANVARGNSGGPLVDECGRVIGVNSFITGAEEGDSPFGFAISNRELASFLLRAKQEFPRIASECVSMSDRLRDERSLQEREESERLRLEREAAQRAQLQVMADIQETRENRAAIALLLGAFGLLAAGAGGLAFLKDRYRLAYILGGVGIALILAGAVTFFTRPSRSSAAAKADSPAKAVSYAGTNVCRFVPDRSRVTVSSVEDVQLGWAERGCVNGRTQYARSGGSWSRILVPNDEATVSVTEFRPATGEYVVSRYLLSAADMQKARDLRSEITIKSCTSDENELARLTDRQQTIRSILPGTPNERLFYRCARQR